MTTNLPARRRRTELILPDRLPESGAPDVAPPTSVRGLGLAVVLLGFGVLGGLGTWASVAPMTSAVVGGGAIEVDGDVQIVQHFDGGIVREIRVAEGDEVEAGDVIAVLDDRRARAELAILENQLATALAREARLEAEALEAEAVSFPDELREMVRRNPSFEALLSTQEARFRANRQSDAGEIDIYDERIEQLRRSLAGIADRERHLEAQRELVEEEVADLGQLYEKGLMPKARYFERRDEALELLAAIDLARSDREVALQQIAEIGKRRLQVRRERGNAIAAEQEEVKARIFDLRQRIAATEAAIERLTIRAPTGGRVAGFGVNTLGAVLEPGQAILQIVPTDREHIVKARIAPSDVDEIRVGGPARIRLSAYSYRKTPPLEGVVTHISANAFYSEEAGESYYEVFLSISDSAVARLPNVRLVQGMPVAVMIETGEQTLMAYLLDPMLGGLDMALLERE